MKPSTTASCASVIATREERWWRFLTSNDTYDPERMNYDRELLRRHYLQSGYADFEVISAVAELAPNRENFYMTFTVKEGPRYKFSKVDLDVQIKDLPKETLAVRRHPAYRRLVQRQATRRYRRCHHRCLPAASAMPSSMSSPRITRNADKNARSTIVFDVQEGPRVFVERVDVVGNVRTLDKVIRREILLAEGDAFNTSRVRRSKERLWNLGFFKQDSVKVDNTPSDVYPDRTILRAKVDEQSTGELQLRRLIFFLFGCAVQRRRPRKKSARQGPGYELAVQHRAVPKPAWQLKLSPGPHFMDRQSASPGVKPSSPSRARLHAVQRVSRLSNRPAARRSFWLRTYNEYLFQRGKLHAVELKG